MDLKYGLVNESYKCRHGIWGIKENKEAFTNDSISLVSAKNSSAAFQICFIWDRSFTVSLGNSPLFNPKDKYTDIRLACSIDGIAESNISMKPVLYMEDDDGVYKADIISNDENIEVKPNFIQPVWTDITTDKSIAKGIHKGKLDIYSHKMFEDEKKIDTLYFNLEIIDVTMPDPKDYKYHLDLWQHSSNIARKHEVELWSDEHFEVLEKYIITLADLGQKAVTIIASEIPWSGQHCYNVLNYPSSLFEYSAIRVEKDKNGRYIYDYSAVDKYIELCFKYGIDKEIEVFGLFNIWVRDGDGYGSVAPDYPDAIRIRYFDRKDECYKYIKKGKEIKEYIKALEGYFKNKNLLDKVRVCADEPASLEVFMERLNLLKEVAPDFHYKTAINHIEFVGTVKGIEDYIFSLDCAFDQWDRFDEIKKDIKGRLIYYVCCGPKIPNTFLRSNLLESKFLGLLASFMNFDGFLRWNYTAWPDKPRERIRYKYPNWPAGDSNFVYPANDGRPMLTLRYKNFKKGIEFYELIQMIKAQCSNADEIIEMVKNKVLRTNDLADFNPNRKKTEEELFSVEYEDYKDSLVILLDALSEN